MSVKEKQLFHYYFKPFKSLLVCLVSLHIISTTHILLIIPLYCSNKKIILVYWILKKYLFIIYCFSLKNPSFWFDYFTVFSWKFSTTKLSLVSNICKVFHLKFLSFVFVTFLIGTSNSFCVQLQVFLMSRIFFFQLM